MAGSMSSASLVVMSKGTPYTQQSYKVRPCCSCAQQAMGLQAVQELARARDCVAEWSKGIAVAALWTGPSWDRYEGGVC
jgi:hypothetical protein